MQKNLQWSLVGATALILAAATSFAAAPGSSNPSYVSVAGKYTMMGDLDIGYANVLQMENDDGYGFSAAIGTHFNMFKLEAEIGTQKNDISNFELGGDARQRAYVGSGDARINTALVNGFIDLPFGDGFSWYAGGGLGIANVKVSLYDIDSDDSVFAYKLGTGISYAFTPDLGMDLGYEYLATEDVTLDHVDVKDIASNNIVLALKYMF